MLHLANSEADAPPNQSLSLSGRNRSNQIKSETESKNVVGSS